MTDEELQQLVERDNLARLTVATIEHVAHLTSKTRRRHPHPEVDAAIRAAIEETDGIARDRIHQVHPIIREQVASHDRLAKHHGADPLPKKPRKVADEPEGLPDDLLTAYRGLKQRISEVEHITLSPTPIHCGADVPV